MGQYCRRASAWTSSRSASRTRRSSRRALSHPVGGNNNTTNNNTHNKYNNDTTTTTTTNNNQPIIMTCGRVSLGQQTSHYALPRSTRPTHIPLLRTVHKCDQQATHARCDVM